MGNPQKGVKGVRGIFGFYTTKTNPRPKPLFPPFPKPEREALELVPFLEVILPSQQLLPKRIIIPPRPLRQATI